MKEERIRRSMQMIFDRAIVKVVDRCDKEGNTEQPWDDFTIKHLENRMTSSLPIEIGGILYA